MPRVFCICLLVVGSAGQLGFAESPATEKSHSPEEKTSPAGPASAPPLPAQFPVLDDVFRGPAATLIGNVLDPPATAKPAAKPRPACCCCPLKAGGSKSMLLGFTAGWCGPCNTMAPILRHLSSQGVPVKQIDVEKCPHLARKLNVNVVPTFVLLADGNEIKRLVGATTEGKLKRLFSAIPAVSSSAREPAAPATSPTNAPTTQVTCDRMELDFDPRAQTQTIRCFGNVRIQSDKFVATAQQVILRCGKLNLAGKVSITLNQRRLPSSLPASPNLPEKSVPTRRIRFRFKQAEFPPAADSTKPR